MSLDDTIVTDAISVPWRQRLTSLFTSWFWTLVANGSYGASQWLLVVALARLGSPAVVGYYSWSMAVAAPVILLSNVSLRVVLTGDTQRQWPFSSYLRLRTGTTLLAGVVMAAGAVMTRTDPALALMLLTVGAVKCIEAVSDIYYGLYQRDVRSDLVARSLGAKSAFGFTAFALVLAATHSPALAFSSVLLVQGAVILLVDFPYGRCLDRECSQNSGGARDIGRLAIEAGPLGVVWMLNSVASNAPRYLLQHYVGPRELGIFTAVSNIGLISSIICLALGEASIPRFAALYERGDVRRFVHLLVAVSGVAVVLGVVCGWGSHFFGGYILASVYGRQYGTYALILTVTVIAYIACNLGTFVSCALYATGKYSALMPNYVINTLLVLFGSWLCVKEAQLLGGAIAIGLIGIGSIAVAGVTLFARLRERGYKYRTCEIT